MTSRGWIFTSYLDTPITYHDSMKYLCFQREKCPSTGKLHWQGYIEFNNACRLANVKKLIGESHIEKRRGTPQECREYCMKEESSTGERFEYGKLPKGPGDRSDLKNVCELVKNGTPLQIIASEYPDTYVRNYRGLDALQSLIIPKRDFITELHIIWGESGSGKTRSVYDNNDNLYIKPEGKWWDGYNYEETVLIDDVVWSRLDDWMSHTEILKLCDRYPMKVPVKGSYKEFVTKKIYITSMYDPSAWLQKDGIKRRVTSVTRLNR